MMVKKMREWDFGFLRGGGEGVFMEREGGE